MEKIIGRVTGDAKVVTLKDERQVVNFNVAVNDSYRSGGEEKKVTSFYQCAYWQSAKVAQFLTKGTLVELVGRTGVTAWVNMQGEAKGSLTFHVNNIKFHGGGKTTAKAERTPQPAAAGANELTEPLDDLPF